MTRKVSAYSLMYYVAFAIYIFFSACSQSNIVELPVVEKIITLGRYAAVMLMLLRVVLYQKTRKTKLISLLVAILLSAAIYLEMDSSLPLTVMVVILTAWDCRGLTLARIYLLVVGMVVIVMGLLTYAGLLEDKVITRETTDVVRHSFGMSHATVWAGFLFFLIWTFVYCKKKLTFLNVVAILLLDVFMYKQSDARLETLMVIFCLVMYFLYRHNFFAGKLMRWLLVYSMLLSCILAFGMQMLYMKNPSQFDTLNSLLSNRLRITASVIDEQGFHLFGKDFLMQGFGTKNFDWKLGYNYVDSFYINYALKYGVLFLVFLCGFFSVLCRRLGKKKDTRTLLFFAVGALHGIIISSILLPQFNPFFVIVVAECYRSFKPVEYKITLRTPESDDSIVSHLSGSQLSLPGQFQGLEHEQ